mmetsp:Transcript_82739/g.145922  ORF Transcript_82739/g.145922 Transcript_82739/m.145922 type:complete len:878 (-) Transcript_82739:914-3547(-)
MMAAGGGQQLRHRRKPQKDDTVPSPQDLDTNGTNGLHAEEQSPTDKCADEVADPVKPEPESWAAGAFHWVCVLLQQTALYFACKEAYKIRLHAVRIYGPVIHEFDPWFNFRATEYLERNGLAKFLTWYDEESWYPLGRPVGTTIFPGMQITAVFILRVLQWLEQFSPLFKTSLNDVCVYMPAYFGAISTIFTFLLAQEASGSGWVGVTAAAIMAIIPAHLMRSVAGGFDNESVAVAAMVCTFYLWVRALRTDRSAVPFGILSGLSYVYMVAAWGGYVFVLNMVGLHAAVLVILGRHSTHLHRAYSLFYVIGTAGALQIPVVGWNPLQSMEQLGPMAVFFGLQLIEVTSVLLQRSRANFVVRWGLLYALLAVLIGAGYFATIWLLESGLIWEFSTRVKSLFIKHTKTGNPLVDSVAEHQHTPTSVYFSYLHHTYYIGPVGCLMCLWRPTEAKYFLIVYCITSAYFASRMIRLVLLSAPAIAAASAMFIALPVEWACIQLWKPKVLSLSGVLRRSLAMLVLIFLVGCNYVKLPMQKKGHLVKYKGFPIEIPTGTGVPYKTNTGFKFRIPKPDWGQALELWQTAPYKLIEGGLKAKAKPYAELQAHCDQLATTFKDPNLKGLLRHCGKVVAAFVAGGRVTKFRRHCNSLAEGLSEPQIIARGRSATGEEVIIDDYREAYWWLRDHTHPDARVLAWWDYGYQITGIGNRTSIADGNTWNHEHIALLGRCLVSSEKKGHAIIRHLADYVLVWTTRFMGMYGDDLAKSPHMARISGSVYPDIDASAFWIDQYEMASPMMQESVLYRLHHYRLSPELNIKLKYFEEAYTTKHHMVRIYKVKDVDQKSKNYPKRRYPPALKKTLAMAKDFSEVKRIERLKAGKFD